MRANGDGRRAPIVDHRLGSAGIGARIRCIAFSSAVSSASPRTRPAVVRAGWGSSVGVEPCDVGIGRSEGRVGVGHGGVRGRQPVVDDSDPEIPLAEVVMRVAKH